MNTKNSLEIKMPFLEEIVKELKTLRHEIVELKDRVHPERELYDLKTACAMKGINYHTASSKHKYQPNSGIPDCHAGGGRRWKHTTICEWLKKGDDELPKN